MILIVSLVVGFTVYKNTEKIIPFYAQLIHDRVGTEVDLQNNDQKKAHFVGSSKCIECHKENHDAWRHSGHPKMIQDFRKDPSAVVADFSKLPKDANFKLEDATYTIGSKFKQRFMIRKDFKGKEDYVLGNYQWNVQTGKWQHFKPWEILV